jgi:hypothetical protein
MGIQPTVIGSAQGGKRSKFKHDRLLLMGLSSIRASSIKSVKNALFQSNYSIGLWSRELDPIFTSSPNHMKPKQLAGTVGGFRRP